MTLPNQQQISEHEDNLFNQSVQSAARDVPFGSPDVAMPYDNIYNSGLIFHLAGVVDNIPNWSIYPARRDRALRNYYKHEPIMAGAVYSLSARIKALPYVLTGEDGLQQDLQAMFQAADFGKGLSSLIGKTIIDLATQDNGFFWELTGPGSPESPLWFPDGIAYLDPAQCYRTFDPEYPVMYIDPIDGTRHRMHRRAIVMGSSMTQPNELARGIGFSAISRALRAVQLMRSVLEYRYEKASGSFSRAIIFGKGLTNKTLQKLVNENNLFAESDELTRINKIPAYVTPNGVELDMLDLASIPDNFDTMTETELYVYILALAFGVDAREFWPATSSGATKADASIQNMKARGKGLADLVTTIENAITRYVLPDGMKFEFDFVDDEHDKAVADKNAVTVQNVSRMKADGVIDGVEARAMLIQGGVLDADVLENAKDMPGMAEFVQRQEEIQEQMQNENGAENQEDGEGNPDDDGPDDDGGGGISPDSQNDDDDEASGNRAIVVDGGGAVGNRAMDSTAIALGGKFKYVPSATRSELFHAPYVVNAKGYYIGIKDKAGYRASLRAIGRAAYEKVSLFLDTVTSMDGSIRRHYTQAFREGFLMEGIQADEITPAENSALAAMIEKEQSYVVNFVTWILEKNNKDVEGATYAKMFRRIDMWVSRYDRVRARARLLAAKNKKKKWVFDPSKEHCIDCARLNGRVYRAGIWAKYDIEPQSPNLACFGTECGCSFVDTDDPVTPGRPPVLVGPKMKYIADKWHEKYHVAEKRFRDGEIGFEQLRAVANNIAMVVENGVA